jgi:hypothetical protein
MLMKIGRRYVIHPVSLYKVKYAHLFRPSQGRLVNILLTRLTKVCVSVVDLWALTVFSENRLKLLAGFASPSGNDGPYL